MRLTHLLLVLCLVLACQTAERDNPVDPQVSADGEGANLALVVPLPKLLATVVDSLVARLSAPDIPTVVKPLIFTTPTGPAVLTIGAVAPGTGRTLTIEGYDLTGRLILAGERRDITVAVGDTTRVNIDLRLTIDPSELEQPDATDEPAAPDEPDAPDQTEPPEQPDTAGTDDTTVTAPEDSETAESG